MLKAVAAKAVASAHLMAAQARWRTADRHAVLRAPVAGSVVEIPVAAGERVHTGQTIAVVQPNNGLWLTADYYGPQVRAIHPGMHGRFTPADGSADVPVRVVSVGPALQDGGGWPVRMRAAAASGPQAGWINGEAGTVTLNGPHVAMIVVPTRALILDHARWWVMVHTSHGDRPRSVTPGRSAGAMTLIKKGLRAGEKVVVSHAYELYHQHVAGQYTPPD
ncbi:HlyD family efflux transporter periplasmic adaptor subunit [Oleiagrimonas sp. C23AA]|uniref:efflux RND transporter periplasmic adaptor subunit n=1 Tax=Oleiagrimonas sp. C23AA TaxID=2719047 RepID=UPI0014222201|nr:HlyD family efflux transporter periplasmic adaptor subunit [Oleiagrimonas sp. C23AA]NII11182.1 HlyD family efflux transporter periplasmic adaptor subunit [Oleiagrimonas sp. C23AA]